MKQLKNMCPNASSGGSLLKLQSLRTLATFVGQFNGGRELRKQKES